MGLNPPSYATGAYITNFKKYKDYDAPFRAHSLKKPEVENGLNYL
jgi:hypothetical protein